MKNTLITIWLLLLFCGCAGSSGISSIPNIEDKFGKATERILLLPIWKTYLTIVERSQRRTKSCYVFGDPHFLTVKELPDFYNKVSVKATVNPIYIDAVVIISETGKMVRIFCHAKTLDKVPCETTNDSYIFQQWRDELVLAIKKSSREVSEVVSPDDAISGLYEMYGRRYQIPWSSNDKQSVIDFFNSIKY